MLDIEFGVVYSLIQYTLSINHKGGVAGICGFLMVIELVLE
jgi:hypothetical protein